MVPILNSLASMKLEELDYKLPKELIAQYPRGEREESRLMVLDLPFAKITHSFIKELPEFLPEGALLIFNSSKVIPARLWGRKETGGKVEVLLVRREKKVSTHIERWYVLLKSKKPLKKGVKISIDNEITIEVLTRIERSGEYLVEISANTQNDDIYELIKAKGETPLPPYIKRKAEPIDRERYQTVFAKEEGSIAAPTAGLHFSNNLLTKLKEKGIKTGFITLHIGPGTFKPIRVNNLEEHKMEEEYYFIPKEVVNLIKEAKEKRKPVVAVGTTVVRTLEDCYKKNKEVISGAGKANIFIYPPFEFKVVDWLITNFHLPKSTLLALVGAFAGLENIKQAYKVAIEVGYYFYSYGDAMLIRRDLR